MNAYDVEARHGGLGATLSKSPNATRLSRTMRLRHGRCGMGRFADKEPIYAGTILLSSTSLGALLAVVSHTNLYRFVLWSLPSCSKSTTMVMLRDLDFLDYGHHICLYITALPSEITGVASVSCSSGGGE